MAAKGSVSKLHNTNARVRKLGDKIVKPVLYNGIAIGHGKYFAGEVDGQLVLGDNGKPLQFRQIGDLVLAD